MNLLDLYASLALALLAVAVYANSLRGQFVFDDMNVLGAMQPHAQAAERSRLGTLLRLPLGGRAFTYWTYFRDMHAHGFEPESEERDRVRGWHARQIAVHALNAVLIFAILRYFFAFIPAALGAGTFAAHPMGASTVPSIAARSSLLCMTFFLLTIVAFLAGWWILIPVFAWHGWHSKEEYVSVLPTLAVIWWFR